MNLTERVTKLETTVEIKMESLLTGISDVKSMLKQHLEESKLERRQYEKDKAETSKRISELEDTTIQITGKKGWLISGGMLVLLLLLVLNIIEMSDVDLVSKIFAMIP